MNDLKFICENVEIVKSNLKKRKFDLSIIDKLIEKNNSRKQFTKFVEEHRAELNKYAKEIGAAKAKKQDATALMDKVAEIKKLISHQEEQLAQTESELLHLQQTIPNLIASDVPEGSSEEDNVEIKKWGEPKKFNFPVLDHVTLGEKLGMLDFETAALLTGARFALVKGKLARLERAISNFMLDFHLANNYEEIIPPYIVHERSLVGTGQLPKFKEDLFKIENFDWYLIPTSEVPLTNILREQVVPLKNFPFKYTSLTPCFRSEAGSYGKDTKGLIRMHQFQKVEMVQITTAEQSEKAHEEMIEVACKILQLLELPYRALKLCSADIGFGSRKTIDLEVWLPAQNKYREISSISNCGDFQARRCSIRYKNAEGVMQFAHTLNGSGLAVGRTLVAILENYQQIDGSIIVPKVLVPYCAGMEKIS